MPTLEPAFAGLTNTGQPSFFSTPSHTPSRSDSISQRSAASHLVWGTPLASNRALATALSMHTALASTPQPTEGMPASSSRPCTVPSSPHRPWSTGMTTSTCTFSTWPSGVNRIMPWSARSGLMTQAMLPASSSQLPSAIWAAVASVYSQRPSLVMPTVSTSYFSRSMLLTKLPTETRLTSCSLDIPPNSSTTHIFSDCMITLSYLQSPRPGRDITGKNAVLAYYTISMRAMQAECQKAAGG